MKTRHVLTLLAILLGVAVLTSAPAQGLAKIKCDAPNGVQLRKGADVAVFTGAIDPIVNHGEPAAAHTHDFFGSSGWQAEHGNNATYGDVVTSATNCREQGDTGAYWTPVLRCIKVSAVCAYIGQRIPIQQFTAYYRGFAGQTTHAGSQPFPEDVRLVATDDKGYGAHGWNCGEKSAQAAREGTVDAIPDCTGEDGTPGNTLTAHINFPSCWNGNLPNHTPDEVGDTRDNADWTYPTNKTACPATHPIEVVQLRETIQYRYTGNGTDVELDSDHHMGSSDGRSMHADFWNGWNQESLRQMVRNCINTAAEANCAP